MNIWIFLSIATLVRLLLLSLFPLTADESYYWLWAKHLDWSYVDHPPMVAFINFLTTLGKENLFALRLGAILITLLVSIIIYFLAKEIFNDKIAFFATILFQIIPHYLIVWLTMFVELPLALFWIASIFIFFRIIKGEKSALWYLMTVTLGLGYLSKYTMFLFWPCLVVFLLISPKNRVWLKRKESYLCFLLSLIFFLPVIYWNSQHHWASFTFHGSKAFGEQFGAQILPFIGDQLVHFSPFLLFALYGISKYALKKNEATKLLFSFSIPILCFFLLLSLKVKVWAHWPSIGYLAAIPLAAAYFMENGKSLKKFLSWVALFTLLILTILFFVSPGVLWHQKDYTQNFKLSEIVSREYKVFAETNVTASLLEFYLKRPVYLATGFLKTHPVWGEKQYEIWGIPNLKKGETVLYYGEDFPLFKEKAADNFEKITELPDIKLYLIEDYISHNYKMFKLEGFKGKKGHP